MSEYKRWISYVYSYDNNVKKNNVGYIKVEKRNERTKVSIRINVLSVTDPMKVYLYVREKNIMKGTYIGDIVLDKNPVQQAYMFDKELNTNIINISNTGGVIIYNSNEKFFGSEWDDVDIDIDQLVFGDSGDGIDAYSVADTGDNKDVAELTATSLDIEDESSDDPEVADECILTEIAVSEEPDMQITSDTQTTPDEQMTSYEAIEAENITQEDIVSEIAEETIPSGIEEKADDNNSESAVPHMRYTAFNSNRATDRQTKEKIALAAEKMLATYPKMFPFENDDMIKCVRIEPQDIGQLPIDTWALANNSFLLQGYYRYRHLMLISTGEENNPSYLIGVPGVYRSRDEYMAGMFGFGLFKPMNNNRNMRGEFGYWCISVTAMPDSRKYS